MANPLSRLGNIKQNRERGRRIDAEFLKSPEGKKLNLWRRILNVCSFGLLAILICFGVLVQFRDKDAVLLFSIMLSVFPVAVCLAIANGILAGVIRYRAAVRARDKQIKQI